jgi:hypothetical protein
MTALIISPIEVFVKAYAPAFSAGTIYLPLGAARLDQW